MAAHYEWQCEDLILHCYFQPAASCDQIVGVHNECLKIRITAPPIDGKANDHIVKLFSKMFKVPKNNIEILQGELSRQKTVRIRAPKIFPENSEIIF